MPRLLERAEVPYAAVAAAVRTKLSVRPAVHVGPGSGLTPADEATLARQPRSISGGLRLMN